MTSPARRPEEPVVSAPFDPRRWAVERGLLEGPVDRIDADVLAGGVSCEVSALAQGGVEIVVKRARPFLAVQEVWAAPVRRVNHEADVIGMLAALTPEMVPPVLDSDVDAAAIALGRAPTAWRPWKEVLLAGEADPRVARTLGEVLGRWHAGTWDDRSVREIDDYELFEELRLRPYFDPLIAAWPEHRAVLSAAVHTLRSRRTCLVHGDFSPKNVLVGSDGLWVIDCEVGHLGDPMFDVGFLVHHLLLKAVHRPGHVRSYQACATSFLTAYRSIAPPDGALDPAPSADATDATQAATPRSHAPLSLSVLTGALVLARVHGKSPVDYLDDDGRDRAVRLAGAMLEGSLPTLEDAWQAVEASS